MPEGWRPCLLLLMLCVLAWRSQASLAPRFWFGDVGGGDVVVHVDGTPVSAPLDGRYTRDRVALGLPVEINFATASELETVPGIGPRTATKIVASRQSHGCFLNLAALMRVRGIGRKTLSKVGPYLSVRHRSAQACAAARHG